MLFTFITVFATYWDLSDLSSANMAESLVAVTVLLDLQEVRETSSANKLFYLIILLLIGNVKVIYVSPLSMYHLYRNPPENCRLLRVSPIDL